MKLDKKAGLLISQYDNIIGSVRRHLDAGNVERALRYIEEAEERLRPRAKEWAQKRGFDAQNDGWGWGDD